MKKYLLAAVAPVVALLSGNAVAQEAVKSAQPEVTEQKFEYGKADKPNPAADAIQKPAGNGDGKVNVQDITTVKKPASAHEKLGNGIKGEVVESIPSANHLKLSNGIKGESRD